MLHFLEHAIFPSIGIMHSPNFGKLLYSHDLGRTGGKVTMPLGLGSAKIRRSEPDPKADLRNDQVAYPHWMISQ